MTARLDRIRSTVVPAYAKTAGRHSGWDAGIQVPGRASYGNRCCPLQVPALVVGDPKEPFGRLAMAVV